MTASGNIDWNRTVFLHIGWAARYDGTEAPEGGHAYLQNAVGVEAQNFLPDDGWCYGYAPVSRTGEGRSAPGIPIADRTLNIDKLGAKSHHYEIGGITVVWTARRPGGSPAIVGLYDDATVYRYMTPDEPVRPFIARARTENCHLLPESMRNHDIIQKRKGFQGMAAAWFPGLHADGPAKDMLASVADYLPTIRRYSHTGNRI